MCIYKMTAQSEMNIGALLLQQPCSLIWVVYSMLFGCLQIFVCIIESLHRCLCIQTTITNHDTVICFIPATATIIPHQDEAVDAKVNGDSSDEERAWLNALEAGELDDFGEIPKARDPSLLTARQVSLSLFCNHFIALQLNWLIRDYLYFNYYYYFIFAYFLYYYF